MPITYDILNDGHYIHAVATPPVTSEDFIEYEVTHAIDERVKAPVSELFEVKHGACDNITIADMSEVLRIRKEIGKPPNPTAVPSLCRLMMPTRGILRSSTEV
ncbi:MAG: hypothetical protein JRE40_14340 [Deltaproteobacteria bacterium]|nr:hypothetical protein [Deltaproteobacteria bacterium]